MKSNGKRHNCDNKNHDSYGDDKSDSYLELLEFCFVE